ncbi:MAG: glycoside hydrolase family 18 protein [Bacteroidota bacterium]
MRELVAALVLFGVVVYVGERGLETSELFDIKKILGMEEEKVVGGLVGEEDEVLGQQGEDIEVERDPDNIEEITLPHYVVAYILGDHKIYAQDIDATKITHINYAFLDVRNNSIRSFLRNDRHNLAELRKLRRKYPHLSIMVSLGGWTKSAGFSDMAASKRNRKRFAESVVDFLRTYRLDGVDIDWEYPGQSGAGNPHRKEDKQNFTLMVKTLKNYLDDASEEDEREDKPYLLSIAGGVGYTFLRNTEMGKVQRYVDFINLMSYNFAGAWSPRTAHHTNLYASNLAGGSENDVAEVVRQYAAEGVPLNKITIGVAFYGRGWEGVSPRSNGLHQSSTQNLGSFRFHDLRNEYIDKKGYIRYWDTLAKAPYLWNPNDQVFITYDDPESLRYKAQYVKKQQLAGLMFWEYYRDTSKVLLEAVHEELNGE